MLLWSVAGALFVACGQASSTGPGGGGAPAATQIDWDVPIVAGAPVDAPGEAVLAFAPDDPPPLEGLTGIVATEPSHGPRAFNEIAWVYRHPDYGSFAIVERLEIATAWRSDARAMADEKPGCVSTTPDAGFGEGAGPGIDCTFGERSWVAVADGSDAFLFEGPQVTSIEWVQVADVVEPSALDAFGAHRQEVELLVTVMGPSSSFTADAAVTIARAW